MFGIGETPRGCFPVSSNPPDPAHKYPRRSEGELEVGRLALRATSPRGGAERG